LKFKVTPDPQNLTMSSSPRWKQPAYVIINHHPRSPVIKLSVRHPRKTRKKRKQAIMI